MSKFYLQFNRECRWRPDQEIASGITDDTGQTYRFEGAAFVDEVTGGTGQPWIVECSTYPGISPTAAAVRAL